MYVKIYNHVYLIACIPLQRAQLVLKFHQQNFENNNFQSESSMSLTTSNLYAKFGLKAAQQTSNLKPSQSCFLHDLMVNSIPYRGRQSFEPEKPQQTEDISQYTNPKTSFYLCKKYQGSQQYERLPRFLMKRLAYRKDNVIDQWGRTIYNDSQSKNYDQVATEFQCLNLLKGSHRAIHMFALIHENTRSKEDKKFFYHHLKLPDRRAKGIKNVCFIIQEMNEGSLKEQINQVIITKEPFSEQKIIQLTCQFAEGLLQLRSKGIIHRDLRPDNVLLHNGQIKFADFDSAFIKGYSDYINIKNGVDMKQTTPLEIMLLIAESEENLKKLTSQELYEKQEKADIYFLGVNIYTMVFSQPFESFNGGKVLKNLISIKKRSGFCNQLLDLMMRCLEKDAHVRIGMDEVVSILRQIENEFYFKSSTYKKVYLGPEPLNFNSFSSNHIEVQVKTEGKYDGFCQTNNREEMEKTLSDSIKTATIERNTSFYESFFKRLTQDMLPQEIWGYSQRGKFIQASQEVLRSKVEQFLERLQIKAYYYELAYRILLEVNLACIKSSIHFEIIKAHIQLFSSQLVVILNFIYNTVMKCSFTSDPNYTENMNSYEIRSVIENIKTLHSRFTFFSGRQDLHIQANNLKKKMKEELAQIRQTTRGEQLKEVLEFQENFNLGFQGIKIVDQCLAMIGTLASKKYNNENERLSFASQERNISRCLDRMELAVKKQMIQTIISLILAYQKIKTEPWGHRSNLKNAIFMLMILEAQNTKSVQKNDMVIIKTELTTMINLNLGWKSEQLQAFFNNYTHTHSEEVVKGLYQLESQAIITTEGDKDEEDICIQINGTHDGVGQAPKIEYKVVQKEPEYDHVEELETPAEEECKVLDKSMIESDKAVEISQVVEIIDQPKVKENFQFKLIHTEIDHEYPGPEKKRSNAVREVIIFESFE